MGGMRMPLAQVIMETGGSCIERVEFSLRMEAVADESRRTVLGRRPRADRDRYLGAVGVQSAD